MEIELKPCPFCGSTDIRIATFEDQWACCACPDCERNVRTDKSVGEAVKIWNTRPEEDILNAQISECIKGEINQLYKYERSNAKNKIIQSRLDEAVKLIDELKQQLYNPETWKR